MATYTTRNRLVKQATNENRNTWGTTLNGGMIDLVDEAIDGFTSLSMSGNVTLTNTDGTTDQARKRVLNVTSTGGATRTITIPAVEKYYVVRNAGAQYITIKTASGTGVVVLAGTNAEIICDALDCYIISRSGFGLISTSSYTDFSANVLTLSAAGLGCDDYQLVIKGWSTTTTPHTITLTLSSDGATYSSSGVILLTTAAGADTFYGSCDIFNTSAGAGMVNPCFVNVASDNRCAAIAGVAAAAWRHSGGVSYLKLTSSGGTPDAGTFELYGR